MLGSGRFWVGVFVGVILVYAWHMWQAKKSSGQ
jgi:hypothetical protein